MIAGGRTRVTGDGPEATARAANQVRTRLLATLQISAASSRPLV